MSNPNLNRHTPGPWIAHNRGYFSDFHGASRVITARGHEPRIAVVHHEGSSTDEANANLIAAAPDLLAALKAALEANLYDGDLCAVRWHESARAAVAKAEGRPS